MGPELEAHRAQLLAAGNLTAHDLDVLRSTAQDPARFRGEPVNPKLKQVAVGYVRAFWHHFDKHTHYYLIIDGRLLEVYPPRLHELIADGGAYRVYFTAEGAQVNALEPVAPEEVPDAVAEAVRSIGLDARSVAARQDPRVVSLVREELINALAQGLDFTRADLDANRRGVMTASEQSKVRTTAGCFFVLSVFIAVIGAVSAGSLWHDSMLAVALVAAGTLLLVFLSTRYAMRVRADADTGRVISGVALLQTEGSTSSERSLVIPAEPGKEAVSFSVPLAAFSVHGYPPVRLAQVAYRVYYPPHDREVMSLEPVDIMPLLAPLP